MTWQTGYPMAVDSRAASRATARPTTRPRSSRAAEIQVALVSWHPGVRCRHPIRDGLSHVSCSIIGPWASESPFPTFAAIDTGLAGIHERGTAVRLDEIPLPLRPALEAPEVAAFSRPLGPRHARRSRGPPRRACARAWSRTGGGDRAAAENHLRESSPELAVTASLAAAGPTTGLLHPAARARRHARHLKGRRMTSLRITGGAVHDPTHDIDGDVRDICIQDGHIVDSVPEDAPRLDARGMVVMPGGHRHPRARRIRQRERGPADAPRKTRHRSRVRSALAHDRDADVTHSTVWQRWGRAEHVPTGYRYAGLVHDGVRCRGRPDQRARHPRPNSTTRRSSLPAATS